MQTFILLFGVNCLVATQGSLPTIWSHTDFYYRAIAGIYLRVIYYSSDHNNVLSNETLTEIHNIEQQIKSWPEYNDHALIYKSTDPELKALFQTDSSLYLEAAPSSVINYVFPQLIFDKWFMNGNGITIYEEWTGMVQDAYIDWMNADTFNTYSDTPTSPFLVSFYPFGYKNENETRNDLETFVLSYDQLFDTITPETVSALHSHSKYYPQTLGFNDRIYKYTPTPMPTQAPTPNDSYPYSSPLATVCNSRGFGYDTSTGGSTGEIIIVSRASTTSPSITPEPTMNPSYPTGAPTMNPSYTSYPTSAPTMNQVELCGKTFWPKYMIDENNNDMIYFDSYQWNIEDNNNKYYCKVLVKDISFCNGQWQSHDTGQYVDIHLMIDATTTTTTAVTATTTTTTATITTTQTAQSTMKETTKNTLNDPNKCGNYNILIMAIYVLFIITQIHI